MDTCAPPSGGHNCHFVEEKGGKKDNLLRCSSSGPAAPSQGGVKQNVGGRRFDGGGGDIRNLMIVKLVPTLFEGILTVGSVMATVQTSIVVLENKSKHTHTHTHE